MQIFQKYVLNISNLNFLYNIIHSLKYLRFTILQKLEENQSLWEKPQSLRTLNIKLDDKPAIDQEYFMFSF